MEINTDSPQEMKVDFFVKNSIKINVCKGCKGFSKSISLHGGKKFSISPYIPYKVVFLRVNSHGYGYDLGGFFGISAQYPPRILNNSPTLVKVPQEMKVSQNE